MKTEVKSIPTRYFVDYKLHNGVNQGWAFKTTKNTDDLDVALKDFYSQLSTYIGGDTFDIVTISLTDMYGKVIRYENWISPTIDDAYEAELAAVAASEAERIASRTPEQAVEENSTTASNPEKTTESE